MEQKPANPLLAHPGVGVPSEGGTHKFGKGTSPPQGWGVCCTKQGVPLPCGGQWPMGPATGVGLG